MAFQRHQYAVNDLVQSHILIWSRWYIDSTGSLCKIKYIRLFFAQALGLHHFVVTHGNRGRVQAHLAHVALGDGVGVDRLEVDQVAELDDGGTVFAHVRTTAVP